MDSSMYNVRACMTRFGFNSLSKRMACSAHQENPIHIKFIMMLINESDPNVIIVPYLLLSIHILT